MKLRAIDHREREKGSTPRVTLGVYKIYGEGKSFSSRDNGDAHARVYVCRRSPTSLLLGEL